MQIVDGSSNISQSGERIVTEPSFRHEHNAFSPRTATFGPIVIFSRSLQFSNAEESIYFIESGSFTSESDEQFLNAPAPIYSVPFLISAVLSE